MAAAECANPLLLQWIGEWLDTARERNSKGITMYKKAYDSMKACPLSFNHPSQAQQLHGLGPKLCERLTEKLKAHCIANGLPAPEVPSEASKRGAEDGDGTTGPRKKARKAKAYVPTLRSGPYAIIMALSTVPETSSQCLTKAEVIDLGQPFCDSSFTAPSDPTKYFTAWNSMKTLVGKDLVFERGRPTRKYALTEEGWEVAKRMRRADAGQTQLDEVVDAPRQESVSLPNRPRHRPPAAYGDESDEDGAPGRWVGTGPNRRWVDDDDPDSWGDEPLRKGRSNGVLGQVSSARANASHREGSDTSNSRRLGSGIGDKFGTNHRLLSRNRTLTPELERRNSQTRAPEEEGNFIALDDDPLEGIAQRTPVSQTPPPATQPADDDLLPSFTPLRLAPNTFSVQLVLDNREVRAKQDRDYIQEELTKRGVKPIMRSLELGDALWVAKPHDSQTLRRQGEACDEVVLDYIVERKRLDDLVGSIKDGRFHEQKFRLKKSGIKNVIYIIEDISMSAEQLGPFQEAVESAIASTQVVNGYFVKKTAKLDDTIRYLARMTALLRETYEPTTLSIIPTHHLTPLNHLPLLTSLQPPHHITSTAFASLTSKTDALTLRDVFLRMLMCTRGVTGDRAVAIQKRWATPAQFVEAFEGCGVGIEGMRKREELVMKEVGGGVGRKKIGRVLSGKIAEIWGAMRE
ncbi:MAG: Crossover junction endonuclease mus81 [Caeruleum heppii]|nr:MAG: Crossover junction endonuclease mus81 [Caeruleum heppii]